MSRHFVTAISAALLCTGTGACTWYSMTPRESPGPMPVTGPRALNTLSLGVPRAAALDCAHDECNHWYRLDVPAPGTLSVRVETHADGVRPVMRLLVNPIGRDPIAQTMGGTSDVLSVHAPVEVGLYTILVQGGGGRLPYSLVATLERDGG